jgi:hypothetical protein
MHRFLAILVSNKTCSRSRARVNVRVCAVFAGFHPAHLEFVRVFLKLCVGLFACPALSISLFVCVRACVHSYACLVDTSALASFSLSASRFRFPLVTPAPPPPSSPESLKPLPEIVGLFRQSQLFTLGYKSRVGLVPTTLACARSHR